MSWWQELGFAVLIVVLAWGLGWLARWLLRWMTARIVGQTKTSLDDAVIGAAQRPLQWAILEGGVELGLQQISLISESGQAEIERFFFAVYNEAIYFLEATR